MKVLLLPSSSFFFLLSSLLMYIKAFKHLLASHLLSQEINYIGIGRNWKFYLSLSHLISFFHSIPCSFIQSSSFILVLFAYSTTTTTTYNRRWARRMWFQDGWSFHVHEFSWESSVWKCPSPSSRFRDSINSKRRRRRRGRRECFILSISIRNNQGSTIFSNRSNFYQQRSKLLRYAPT